MNPQILVSKVSVFLELDRQGNELQQQREELRSLMERLRDELEARKRQEELIRAQSRAIVELSTPTLEVWDGVLVSPIVGSMDSKRADQLIADLLSAISEQQARFAIVDLTGAVIDEQTTVSTLVRTVQAAELLGARCVLTGLSPEHIRAMGGETWRLEGIPVRRTLRDALEDALLSSRGERPPRPSQEELGLA